MKDAQKDILMDMLKDIGSIEYYKEPITLKNGKESNYYFDIRKAVCGSYETYKHIVDLMGNEIGTNRVDSIVAGGYGGIPIATGLYNRYKTNMTLVRDEPKTAVRDGKLKPYGKKNLTVGYIPSKGDNVIIVDDVFTAGTSMKHMKDVVEKTGANILGAYVVVDRSGEDEEYKEAKESIGIPVSSLLKFEDLQKYLMPSK